MGESIESLMRRGMVSEKHGAKFGGAKKAKPKHKLKAKSYSAKQAAKGKDIGKPGKNFEKIEDKAAAEYGSKEAGERVAGAALAKLRAKKG